MDGLSGTSSTGHDSFEVFVSSRLADLARRVAEAARALCAQGEEPTARAVRKALRGGSPNEIGPLLRAWRESPDGMRSMRSTGAGSPVPPEIADLCTELWQRSSIAAQLEASDSVRRVESESTQAQLKSLREQLQRELVNYGELSSQSARHEAGARRLALQLDESEARERRQLRDLGAARSRILELEATVEQLKAAPHTQAARRRPKSLGRSRESRPAKQARAKGKVARNRPRLIERLKAKARGRRQPKRPRLKSRKAPR